MYLHGTIALMERLFLGYQLLMDKMVISLEAVVLEVVLVVVYLLHLNL